MKQQHRKRSQPHTKKVQDDSFEAVAKRLGCNPDMKEFDAKMKKIARVKRKKD